MSAGLVPYRRRGGAVEVFLVHPGGPFWAKRDAGAWSIAKGEVGEEEPLAAAFREFAEETGFLLAGEAVPLGGLRQPGGKVVHAWAIAADLDAAQARSNTFALEWPPGSGRRREVPEVDRAGWFGLDEARVKLLPGQRGFLDALAAMLEG